MTLWLAVALAAAVFESSLCRGLDVPPPRPRALGNPKPTRDLLSREWELSWPPKLIDVRSKLALYDRFVPVIGPRTAAKTPFFEKRQELFNAGCYPGVEYRIRSIEVDSPGNATIQQVGSIVEALERSGGGADGSIYLQIRPAYPLIPQLEREWPVRVKLGSIPWCLSRGAYNVVTVASSASLAAAFLLTAFAASMAVTLSVVNTRSMEPSILPRDVILVEKLTPGLKRALGLPVAREGDVVFFRAPSAMTAYIERNHLPPVGQADLIVKRVLSRGEKRLCLDVRGDNPRVSLDSRDWGCLPPEDVVGTPLLRVWPLGRAGSLQ